MKRKYESGQYVGKRHELYGEFHNRAPVSLKENALCRHIVIFYQPNDDITPRKQLREICDQLGFQPPDPSYRQFFDEQDAVAFKWERHTEFATFTLYGVPESSESFQFASINEYLFHAWLTAESSYSVLAATNIRVISRPREKFEFYSAPEKMFADIPVAGGKVCDNQALIWSDFQLYPDGFSRVVVTDFGLESRRLGRLVQRLLDVESYRIAALLGLEEAHRVNAQVNKMEVELHKLLDATKFHQTHDADRNLLDQLLALASSTEQTLSVASFRFDASAAYARLVNRRIEELNEQRIQGFQRLSNFLCRRFIPAIDTCEAARHRIQDLSTRIHRDATLMRIRIELVRQEQNSQLLNSMNHRAMLQYKLQQTVETISSVAISYYAIGIFSILAKSAVIFFPKISATHLTASVAPIIIIIVFLGVRKFRAVYGRKTPYSQKHP